MVKTSLQVARKVKPWKTFCVFVAYAMPTV